MEVDFVATEVLQAQRTVAIINLRALKYLPMNPSNFSLTIMQFCFYTICIFCNPYYQLYMHILYSYAGFGFKDKKAL